MSSVFRTNLGGFYEQHQSTHRNRRDGTRWTPGHRGRALTHRGQDRHRVCHIDVYTGCRPTRYQWSAQSPFATATATARHAGSAGASAHLAGALGAAHSRSGYPTASTDATTGSHCANRPDASGSCASRNEIGESAIIGKREVSSIEHKSRSYDDAHHFPARLIISV